MARRTTPMEVPFSGDQTASVDTSAVENFTPPAVTPDDPAPFDTPALAADPDPTPDPTPAEPTLPPELASRFVAAATSEPPSQDQVAIVRQNAGAITTAAEQIAQLPDSRYKSLALTALEEALMWANKAVFQ